MGNLPVLRSDLVDQGDKTAVPELSRRRFFAVASALGGLSFTHAVSARAAVVNTDFSGLPPYGNGTLPAGIRARLIPNVNGLTVNIIEAGYETPGRPAVLMIHGFPNLAYSWRKVMLPLAAAGYHVIAPDCRGFGRTTGWDNSFGADPEPFLMLNMVRDQIALVYALGYRNVAMIVGHDQGEVMAAYGALIRPDIFTRLTIISAPFAGPPSLPFNTANGTTLPQRAYTAADVDAELAKLNPPRRNYADYWASAAAAKDMENVAQGMHNFFRAFYYFKSADYPGNRPHPLELAHTAKQAAEQEAEIPEYYVMERGRSMPATVAAIMPDPAYIAGCKWLTEPEVDVYATEYTRTGWNGALQEYRHRRNNSYHPALAEQLTFSGRTVDVPAQFIAGKQDWGPMRGPGGIQAIGKVGYTNFTGSHLVEHAGHWSAEEQPEQVSELLVSFLREHA